MIDDTKLLPLSQMTLELTQYGHSIIMRWKDQSTYTDALQMADLLYSEAFRLMTVVKTHRLMDEIAQCKKTDHHKLVTANQQEPQ